METRSCALCREGLVPRGWLNLPLDAFFLKLVAMHVVDSSRTQTYNTGDELFKKMFLRLIRLSGRCADAR